ncbi:hypothetical protein CEXT_663861 [Caerostris extrusa]|uniref:Uncharacterized protein n=1 Tax=Caerostris extrusa TaxID=172846 RepID=A0AAV4M972_CAEEX|nr:hypothetical protein CEXT_663861 [Caerostris extrusa]
MNINTIKRGNILLTAPPSKNAIHTFLLWRKIRNSNKVNLVSTPLSPPAPRSRKEKEQNEEKKEKKRKNHLPWLFKVSLKRGRAFGEH